MMAEAKTEVGYISAGANRHAEIADWGADGTFAFGADSNICLWNPSVGLEILEKLEDVTSPLCAGTVSADHSC
jgi:hypothetical protein